MAESAGSGPGRARGRGRAVASLTEPPVRRPVAAEVPMGISNGHPNGGAESAAGRAAMPQAANGGRGGGLGVGRGSSRGREGRNEVAIYTRPAPEFVKKGKTGNPVDLISNYFEVISRPDMHLLQYRVDFNPEIDHMGVRKALVRVHEDKLGKYLFDGTLLYNTNRLHQTGQTLELVSRRLSDEADVKITFKLVGEIQKEDPVYNAVINIIFRRCLSMLNLTEIRRNYYDSAAAQEITQHNLTFWPGYQATIAYHENGFLLGVDIVHKVLRRDTAYNVLERVRRDGGEFVSNAKAALEGQIVMTLYNKKTYRVDELDFNQTPMSTFHLRKENRDVTYVEYYRTRYPEARVTDMKQPLLVSRPSRRDLNRGDDQPIFLIPELCSMTGLAEDQRRNFNLMRDVAQVTRLNPDRRVESLMRFRRRLQDNPRIQEELNKWGLQFSRDLVKVPARLLKPETIVQGQEYPTQQGDWSRQIQRNRYCVSVEFRKWFVAYPTNMEAEVRTFIQTMKQIGGPHNFAIPEPVYVPMQGDRNHNYVEVIQNECSRNEYDMVLVVLRAARTDTYQAIKQLTLVQFGIPSQVVTQRVIRGDQRKVMSVATKVTIQVASKLGAEPWRVKVPNTKWMVVGYDTYHDARQSRAVGAFVASINPSFTKYNSSVEVHRNNEEISPSFRQHMLNSLKAFYLANRTLPDKVIMYRDGVGAGDIARLKETEVAALKAACQEAGKKVSIDYNPGIAFVVVSKRINTRFFSHGNGRPPGNPECGTVVDDIVTKRERYDFFVVSQKTTQGSVSPTSFNVIEDTSGIAPDVQQRLANALTHVYFNWPGTLRVPGPVQYAHKLAYLVGESLNLRKPHDGLSSLPYYL